MTFDKSDNPEASPLYQSFYQSDLLLLDAMTDTLGPGTPSHFEQIRRVNTAAMIG